jgi:hypothetical protein
MKSWVVGFVLGSLLLTDSLFLDQPLSALNMLVGVFLYLVILVNWYGGKR